MKVSIAVAILAIPVSGVPLAPYDLDSVITVSFIREEIESYKSPAHVGDVINQLRTFEDYEYILMYKRGKYGDPFEDDDQEVKQYIVKEVCTSDSGEEEIGFKVLEGKNLADIPQPIKEGCKYPYYNADMVMDYRVNKTMRNYIQHKICDLGDAYWISTKAVTLSDKRRRTKLVEGGCETDLYIPYITRSEYLSRIG